MEAGKGRGGAQTRLISAENGPKRFLPLDRVPNGNSSRYNTQHHKKRLKVVEDLPAVVLLDHGRQRAADSEDSSHLAGQDRGKLRHTWGHTGFTGGCTAVVIKHSTERTSYHSAISTAARTPHSSLAARTPHSSLERKKDRTRNNNNNNQPRNQ